MSEIPVQVSVRLAGSFPPRWRSFRCALGLILGGSLMLTPPAARAQREPATEIELPGPTRGAEERLERAGPSELELPRSLPTIVQAGPVDPETYVLGPGDVLELDLWGRITRRVVLAVSPEGTVFLPGSGPLRAAGRTLAWSRAQILRLVGEAFREVRADVRLVQLRQFKVYVVGFVNQPGAVVATSTARASEAISGLGLMKGASRRNIEIRRQDGSRLRLDLALFEAAGRQELDPTLVDGDVIAVPKAKEFIAVTGAVARPDRFELASGDSLSTLLELGGGLLPSASPDQALLVRFRTPSERETIWADLGAVRRGERDIRLQDGDQLFVQFRSDYHVLPVVEIVGEVLSPGTYPIVLGANRLGDLIRWSGGFRPLANRSGIHLLRENPGGAEQDPEFDRLVRLTRSEMTESEYAKFQTKLAERKNSFRVDWSRIQKGNDDIDPLLQPGDIIRIDQLVSTVRVEGEVRRPGFVDFTPGRSLRQYIELSGGYTDYAARGKVRVSRALTGQVMPARSLGNIEPGDFIWVPERKDVDAWGVFRDAVTVMGQVAVIVFTLSRR